MTLFDTLHFARPYWLLLVPACWILFALIQYQRTTSSTLNQAIDKNLLVHLEHKGESGGVNKWLGIICFSCFWVGLAGISWTQTPSTMFESSNKTILVVDQSMSMYATDIKPDRETQLKQTIRDILSQSKDGDIALVAFAGDAYVISPFSQDKETITHFLVALNPLVMPVYGSNLTSGIKTALSLVKSKSTPVHLIVLTDSVNPSDQSDIPDLLEDYNARIDVIAIGTEQGGEIQLPDGRVLKANGQKVTPTTPIPQLQTLSQEINGRFYHARLSSSELNAITDQATGNAAKQADNKSIHWLDQGQWLALPFLLWLAFQFRRGMLVALLFGIFMLPTNKATASPLDWFKTPDQKGQQAVDQGDWKTAAKHFQRPDWQAASAYALGDYSQAATTLAPHSHNSADYYNLGNALALAGKTDDAIAAYQKALELDPGFKQAQDNLNYLEKQKQKQEQKQKQQQQKNKQQKTKPQNQDQEQQSDQDKSRPENKPNSQNNSKKDNKSPEKQDKKPPSEDNKETSKTAKNEQQKHAEDKLNNEQKQALNQWLRQIQDDPGTLLQRKLWYLHQEKRHENRFSQEDGQNPW
ncbi:VWA domain-containing protein [Marinomonas pollencensis]|uniref:Ca-activated chloride channel family protein n=1 Tax=Marinomonas pollencensis TaxID=491954 RepID=A0A3E0DSG6_9GAMM|nr:VWA domain-containing protein [Marinomonas pollencensis]REG86487.1 Ca-activated chloride channel family protein [Marinomonas pollencensis]